jgi:hypothetical protein
MTSDLLATFRRCDHRVPGSLLNHRNCETRNTFATANRAKAFGAISLHRDRSTDCARKSLTHFLAAWRQLWPFAHHSGIDIAGFKARFSYESSDLAEQTNAVSTSPLRIGIGKVLAYIAEAGRAKQCVGTGMSHHIGIAVAH